jgi:small subunit ribosomal protein S16
MLAIRLQRTGRKGHAMFRMVVQDSRRTPTSGRFVAQLGSFDPHSKTVQIDKEKAQLYLKNGARPSERVARLLKAEGLKLPSWVELDNKKAGKLRNSDKLRKNRPAEEKVEEAPKVSEETPKEA